MIDVVAEDLFPLAELPEHWPLLPGGRKLHRTVGYRYAKRGVGRDRIRLETIVVGGTRYTSKQAVQRFAERTTAAADGPPPEAPVQRRRGRTAAAKLLDEAGI